MSDRQFHNFIKISEGRARVKEAYRKLQVERQKQEQQAAAVGSYLRACEKSQKEVIDGFDRFCEGWLEWTLAQVAPLGCTLDDMAMVWGPLQANLSQELFIEVRGERLIRIFRESVPDLEQEGGIKWTFTAEVIEDGRDGGTGDGGAVN